MFYKLSQEAKTDLVKIGRYTQRQWGEEQRRKYLATIDAQFTLLADNPSIGRQADTVGLGYQRFEVASHVIFYKVRRNHILISRILHKSTHIRAHVIAPPGYMIQEPSVPYSIGLRYKGANGLFIDSAVAEKVRQDYPNLFFNALSN